MITSKLEMDRRTFMAGLGGCVVSGTSCGRKARPITAGGREFTEQRILTEIIAQHVEKQLGIPVGRRAGFESTQLIHQALMLHDIDLYVEYSGAQVAVVLREVPDKNPEIVLERVRRALEQSGVVSWLDPLGINNPFAISIPGSIARQNRIEALEDAAAYSPGWVLSTTSEFQQRPDGYSALVQTYPLRMRAVPVLHDAGSLYAPIEQNRADMIAGRFTDSILADKDLVVLKDMRKAFAPCSACIAVRNDTLTAYPRLRPTLAQLSGKFTTDLMRKMNVDVDTRRLTPRDAAAAFLRSAGLV
jgi:glycine betaine/choline ABC-type transport system substrate-binding protein